MKSIKEELLNLLEPYRSKKKRLSREGIRVVDFTAGRKLVSTLKKNWQEYAGSITPYPGGFKGKGIVICAGGIKYFTCAWVNITLLRKRGCTLPIEVWYSGYELNAEVIEQLQELDVVCKNARNYSTNEIGGFALKPFAILHSAFKEILFLDADNNAAADPAYLFHTDAYKKYGTIFWPDIWITDYRNPIWKIVDSKDYDSMEQESGQLLVNKEKCWKELNLCMYFNENSKYYYEMLLGDKDTFKFAWIALRTPFHMINTPVGLCGYTDIKSNVFMGMSMVQHDPEGRMLLIHRNLLKWDITMETDMIWKEIKRFRSNEKKQLLMGYHVTETGARYHVVDAKGDLANFSFHDIFGDLESECLEILTGLRAAPFYGRFLVHSYLHFFNPVYDTKPQGDIKKPASILVRTLQRLNG